MSAETGSGSAGLTAHQEEGFLIGCPATEEKVPKDLWIFELNVKRRRTAVMELQATQ